MSINYTSIEATRTIRTSNIAVFRTMFTSMEVPVVEVIANAVDAVARCKGERRVEVSFPVVRETGKCYLDVRNTGNSVDDLYKMLDLGHDFGDVNTDNVDNHLRGVGLKCCIGYLAPHDQSYSIETKHRDGWYKVVGPYTEVPNVSFSSNKDFVYGDGIVTRVSIEIEDGITNEQKMAIRDLIEKKYSMAFMADKKLQIIFEGDPLSYVVHGNSKTTNIISDDKEILNRLYDDEHEDKRANVKIVRLSSGIKAAEVVCPIINGRVQVVSMQAEPNFDGINLMGVSVFNHGMRVEYSCGDVISKASRYNVDKLVNFVPMPSNRNEFAVLSTYVNLIPGSGVKLPYTGDKKHVDWKNSEVGRELRVFIDELVGGYYRDYIRRNGELKSRADMDGFCDNVYGEGNSAYIKEGVIYDDGYTGSVNNCPQIDGIIIPKTIYNESEINAYKESLDGKRRITYKLTKEKDFRDEVIIPSEATRTDDWVYNFKVIEYKNINNTRLRDSDIAQAEKYVKYLCSSFGLERKRVHVILIGRPDSSNGLFNRYLKISREDGFRITIQESLVALN